MVATLCIRKSYTSSCNKLGTTMQVFVRRYPGGGDKQQVSLGGGRFPIWSWKGDALLWEGEALVEVTVRADPGLAIGAARRLFTAADVDLVPAQGYRPALDVAPDGRFPVERRSSDDPLRGLLVVDNWSQE